MVRAADAEQLVVGWNGGRGGREREVGEMGERALEGLILACGFWSGGV